MWIFKPPKTNKLPNRLIERIFSMLAEMVSKTMHVEKDGNWWREKSKTMNEVKLVKNIK